MASEVNRRTADGVLARLTHFVVRLTDAEVAEEKPQVRRHAAA
jgi:hypothetical protein